MEKEASSASQQQQQQFCLRWHNHQSSVLGGLPALLDSGKLTDVTLCAGGRSLRAHRIVLSTCSPYFMDIFKDLPATQQPVVVILGGGWAELCCLVAFMYAGEVTLPRNLLPGLLRLAKALNITGLTDLNGNIPDVPLEAELDDSFNEKFESNFSIGGGGGDGANFSRQNSDSASSVDNTFQRPSEGYNFAKRATSQQQSEFAHDGQESDFFKTFSTHSYKDEVAVDESCTQGFHFNQRKKLAKASRPGKYLSPALSELELKNRKIDKIVENLKCNRLIRTTQETIAPQQPLRAFDRQTSLNDVPDVNSCSRATAADVFAGNDLFMETTTTDREQAIKSETDSSPEILLDHPRFSPVGGQSSSSPSQQPQASPPKLFATCYVCHKRLSNQYNLRVHLETHQNARHACVACNHVSRSRDALRKHVSYRHPQLNTSHGHVGRPCKANSATVTTSGTATTSSTSGSGGCTNLYDFSGDQSGRLANATTTQSHLDTAKPNESTDDTSFGQPMP